MVRGFQGAGASCLAPSRAYPATEVNRVPSPIMKLNNATMRTSHTPYLLTRTGSGTWDLHKSPPEHKVRFTTFSFSFTPLLAYRPECAL
jgi:hypothetical protein